MLTQGYPFISQTVHQPNRSSAKPFICQTVHLPNRSFAKPFISQTVHQPNRSSAKPFISQTVHQPNRSFAKPFISQTVHLPNRLLCFRLHLQNLELRGCIEPERARSGTNCQLPGTIPPHNPTALQCSSDEFDNRSLRTRNRGTGQL